MQSSRQRFGTTVIVDTVHGANTAKIRSYRMDANPHYGELAKIPTHKLRKVINHLQLYGYLHVTNDEYAIVKLTEKSEAVLLGEGAGASGKGKEGEKEKRRPFRPGGYGIYRSGGKIIRKAAGSADRNRQGRKSTALYRIFR